VAIISCLIRERLHNFCESASKKPLISLVGGIVRDYQPLWESVYFYSNSLPSDLLLEHGSYLACLYIDFNNPSVFAFVLLHLIAAGS
jgi:hypothetical protein